MIRKVQLSLFILIFIMIGIIFLLNIYYFNKGTSISYGTDSSSYESVLISMRQNSIFNDQFRFILLNQFKGLQLYLLNPIYQLISNNIIAGIVVIIFSLFTYISTIVTVLNLLTRLSINNYKKSVFFIFFNFFSIGVVFSFLRDVYVLFFLVEFIFIYETFKKSVLKNVLLVLILSCLFFLRNFYVFFILAFLIIKYIYSLNYKEISVYRKFFIVSIFLVIMILFVIFNKNFVYMLFGKILLLQSSDKYSIGAQYVKIDINKFYSNGYSLFSLLILVFNRFIHGAYRFLVAPIFTTYLNIFNVRESSYYFGNDIKLYLILGAAIYDFYLFPALFASLVSVLRNFKQVIRDNTVLFYSVVIYSASFLVYSIKFLGKRNMKIDFVDFIFLIMIIVLTSQKKVYFFLGLLLMLVLNFYFAFVKFT